MVNKARIISNAFFLMLRSIVTIFIGLYASRLLLEKLGVDNYGLYYVVGGIVVMFNSLRSFFSSSIQRFLNYTKGQGDSRKLTRVFNVGVAIQLLLSLIFLILLESAGLYAFIHLNLPPNHLEAAKIVFQVSIFTAIVSMLTVPFDAIIIANERMDVFSLFSIIDSLLRLAIIFLISVGPFEQLVNYALLMLVVAVITLLLNAVYSFMKFEEVRIRPVWDRSLVKEMGEFAGWNFLGNTGFAIAHEGVNYLLNLMGGVAVNAARAVVYQMMSAVNVLVGNISVAFKPQTNASASLFDKQQFYGLLYLNAKTTLSVYVLFMFPLVIFSNKIIDLWLGSVPEYVVPFLTVISFYYLFRTMHTSIDLFFSSIGEMKYYQIMELCIMTLNIPCSILLLYLGFPFWTVFGTMTFFEILNQVCVVLLATYKFNFPLKIFAGEVYLPFCVVLVVALFITWFKPFLLKWSGEHLWSLILLFVVIEFLLVTSIYLFVLKKKDREYVQSLVIRRVFRK